MTDPKRKLEVLEGSYKSGVINKEEYDKWKQKLEPDAKEFDKKTEELKSQPEEEPQKSSEKSLIIGIIAVIALFAAVIAFSYLIKPEPKTLEDLHVLNIQGKLKPSQGYVYKNAYSFITLDGLWYTQLSSPKGTKIYSLSLRYSPKDLKDVTIEGNLDYGLFNNKTEYYATFNPTGNDFSHVGLAVADFNTHMSKVFEKNPVAACDRNETDVCKTRPIVTCLDADKLVLYVREAERFRAYYNNNCIVVEGNGLDLVKGVDRILYNLYNIMAQEEV